jgi:5'-nucleotidase (lipoprotein e(P4) family)
MSEYTEQAVLWQQHAAEYRALAYQAYNIARLRLENYLERKGSHIQNPAVITDIDETVLDNSPFAAKLIELDSAYTRSRWLEWGNLARADTIPGSLGFFRYAAAKGVEIFYISNRYAVQLAVTIKNLREWGYPFADTLHVLLNQGSAGKEVRRGSVAKNHHIILLIGDNLADFSDLFQVTGSLRRNVLADSLRSEFGRRFILLPNPVYGDWETRGIYEGKSHLSKVQQDSIRRASLRSY